jgi:hypothetical protein
MLFKTLKTVLVPLVIVFAFLANAAEYPLRDAVECTPRSGLPNVLAKLQAGKEVKIAYLGGSITAAPGWRVQTLKWFQKTYPQSKVSEVNAAIGGTGSDLGVFRVDHDVLRFKPDLMFVEFAVNDGGADPERIHRSMEGIVRQSWKALPEMDICFVYTLAHGMVEDLKKGKYPRSASAMEAVADHYAIPSIHFGVEVARLEKDGKLVFKGSKPKTEAEKQALGDKILFSEDGVHPLVETGHELYTRVVSRSLDPIGKQGKPGVHVLGAPLVADNMEAAKMVPLSRIKPGAGWTMLDRTQPGLARNFGDRMDEVWKADQAGAKLSFKFKGTSVGIYDLLGPDGGQLKIKLDDKPETTSNRIDGYCTYHRLASLAIASGLPDAVHTVTIELTGTAPDKKKILFAHNLPDMEKNPAKYAGNTWHAGAIMIIGEIVE